MKIILQRAEWYPCYNEYDPLTRNGGERTVSVPWWQLLFWRLAHWMITRAMNQMGAKWQKGKWCSP